jgi:hypothetical protein
MANDEPPNPPKTRMSIAEIEALLDREEDDELEMLPNGEIVAKGTSRIVKPLTFRERLGGEYARI